MSLKKQQYISQKFLEKFNDNNNYNLSNSILFADIETVLINGIHQPIAFGYCDIEGKVFNTFIVSPNSRSIKDDFLKIFRNFIHSVTNATIFFHNLSHFDGYLILKILYDIVPADEIEFIEKNNKIYQITYDTLTIKDSFLLLPESLKKLSHSTNKYYKKSEFKYENITDIWYKKPFLVKVLLKNDILSLWESFTILSNIFKKNFNVNIIVFLSLPSITLSIFLNQFYEKELIFKNNKGAHDFFRRSYFGGTTELYQPYLKNGFYYDVNSLYPTVMSLDIPLQPCCLKRINFQFNLSNFFGFLEVRIITPVKITNPFLLVKTSDDKVIEPRGDWTGVYFSEELKLAISLGYRIKVCKTYGFKRGKIFKEYINLLYKIKKLCSANIPIYKISKLLLNSLYGRFGMYPIKDEKKVVSFETLFELKSTKIINEIIPLDNNNFFVNCSDKKLEKNINKSLKKEKDLGLDYTNTAVQVASCVTSYARIFMYRYKNLPHNFCYYSDTDSVFMVKKFSNFFINSDFGKFKYVDRIKFAYFVAIKNYIYLSNNNVKNLRVKGVKVNEQKSLTSKVFFDKLRDGMSNNIVSIVRIDFFVKNLKQFLIFQRKSILKFKIRFLKRNKTF